jgi:succinate dehydrogenase / fumarate reductase, cytochrome b subunit
LQRLHRGAAWALQPQSHKNTHTMSTTPTASRAARPEYRNLNVFKDLTGYRLPAAGWVSILHRISGVIMFLLLPLLIWLFDKSLTSELSYERFASAMNWGAFALGPVKASLMKLILLALIWAYLHHFIAGVRHLWMDSTHAVTKEFGTNSAWVTLVLSIGLTVAFGLKLLGIY